jgi:anionic cell wall polymer biosynthesis LytR-Cps2A-Psr (LCP) family protein
MNSMGSSCGRVRKMTEFITTIINGTLSFCEVWKVSTLRPKFEVSNLGNVRSKETKELLDLTNYYMLNRFQSVNILVAKEFCENNDTTNNTVVAHDDNNKQNNRATNLRWTTYEMNEIHKPPSSRNHSGLKGTSFEEERNKFRVRIKKNGHNLTLKILSMDGF